MDTAIWIAQVILALAFLAFGFSHLTYGPDRTVRRGMEWMGAVPTNLLRTIGLLEILGAIGLVLPVITGIQPWISGLAALMIAILMVLAIVFHARRPGETQNIIFNVVLLAGATFVAYGRFVLEPF